MDRNTRLHALVEKVAPEAAAHYRDTGDWPPDPAGGKHPGAPYEILTLPDGSRRVKITNIVTGDAVGATGATIDEAITALEAKLAPR